MPDTYEPEGGNTPTPSTSPAPHHVRPVLLVLLGATVIIALSAIALLRTGRVVEDTPSSPPIGSLVITPAELTLDQGGELKNFTATYNGEDVTQQAFWYSDNETVAIVATLEPNRGTVSALRAGNAVIRASLNGTDAVARVTVTKPGLRVECMPLQATARVGDEVRFIAEYHEGGVPNYGYEWTGDDGLSGTEAFIRHTYTIPGVKRVHFKTTDTAGTTAEDDCEVTITQ